MEHIQDIDRNSLLYYQGVISPKLQSLDKKRKQKLRTLWYLRICLTALWLILIVLGITCFEDDNAIKFILIYSAILFFAVYFSVKYFISNEYLKKTRKKIIRAVLNLFGNFEWNENSAVDLSDLVQSGLVNNYGLGSIETNLEGVYKDIHVSILKIQLNYLHANSDTKEKCCGIFCTFNLLKKLNGRSVISEDLRAPIPNLKPVNLDDEEFGRMFRIYSNEPGETKYLLTKDVIEAFKKLRHIFKTNVGAAFFENKVFFAIFNENNYFALKGLNHSLVDIKQLQRFIKGLWAILGLVDAFKANKDLDL